MAGLTDTYCGSEYADLALTARELAEQTRLFYGEKDAGPHYRRYAARQAGTDADYKAFAASRKKELVPVGSEQGQVRWES